MTDLAHVYWLGGGTGAGKSTIARHLADRFGLRIYDTDRAMGDHTARSSPGDAPSLQEFLAMDMDQRWANRSPEVMLDTFHWFRGEAFELIVDDLRRLPPEPVVVEGFRLLPELVEPLLGDRRRGVWLLPTPERALGNLLERDRLFTERVSRETERLGLARVVVDLGTTEEELAGRVAELFGLVTHPESGQSDFW